MHVRDVLRMLDTRRCINFRASSAVHSLRHVEERVGGPKATRLW